MAKINSTTIERWKDKARAYLSKHGLGLEQISTGRDAWAVSHAAGITSEAYEDRTVTDGHIQTALERIFPNAVFRDKKAY